MNRLTLYYILNPDYEKTAGILDWMMRGRVKAKAALPLLPDKTKMRAANYYSIPMNQRQTYVKKLHPGMAVEQYEQMIGGKASEYLNRAAPIGRVRRGTS
jgi:hypothetical protein